MINVDTETRAGAMLSAGRVTVTFRSPTGTHITIIAKCKTKDDKNKWVTCSLADARFIAFEIPSDTGWNDRVGRYTRRNGFVADEAADDARAWCAKQLLRFVTGESLPEGLEAKVEDRCGKCGRELTDPVSIERGIGPECYGAPTGSKHETKVKRPKLTPAEGRERAKAVKDKVAMQTGHVAKPERDLQMSVLAGTTFEDMFTDERYGSVEEK